MDTQTILTIHNSIITRNQRVSLSHREHKEWKLHISNVQEVDRGWYMCQVNTDPMRSKRGYIEVQGKRNNGRLYDLYDLQYIIQIDCGVKDFLGT